MSTWSSHSTFRSYCKTINRWQNICLIKSCNSYFKHFLVWRIFNGRQWKI